MTREETLERDEVSWKNQLELVRLMREHNLFIRAADFPNWRPTVRAEGEIPGVCEGLTIIATDGLLGYFLNPVGETFVGHIQRFSGEVKTLFGKDKPVKSAASPKKRVRKSAVQQALDLLETLKPKT
jgi:hypothetical protein